MPKWLLIDRQQYSENTPEYGHGDYPDKIDFILMVVEAETERKAQNAAKKLDPRLRFGGMFAPVLIRADAKAAKNFTQPADPRLGLKATAAHKAALLELAR